MSRAVTKLMVAVPRSSSARKYPGGPGAAPPPDRRPRANMAFSQPRLRPGKEPPGEPAQGRVHQEGQERYPEDVDEDHVHREKTPDEEDPVAETLLGGDGLGGGEKEPCRPERKAHRLYAPRQDLGEG